MLGIYSPMLLAIDIGNTSLNAAIFQGKKIVQRLRLPQNEISLKSLKKLFSFKIKLEGVIVTSVVPKVDSLLTQVVQQTFALTPLIVQAKNIGVAVSYCNPKEVGTDRLVNARAAFEKYQTALLIVDFGTATTFDYINSQGAYCGGAIAPGIELANESLHLKTAQLPKVPIKKTARVIGKRTAQNMQAGVFHGYVGLTDHLVKKMCKESLASPKVIATGGYAKLIAASSQTIEKVHPDLTLEGLRLIWQS